MLEVGYAFRFEDKTSKSTRVKFVTDGLLLREVISDSLLSKYSVVIIDEAHERTLRSDVLLTLLKEIQKKRSNFKIIVMSATINAEKFVSFFKYLAAIIRDVIIP